MKQSKEERVHQVFEKIYSNYDTMNSIISFQKHKTWRKDVMKRMNVQEGMRALDVCCGTGDWSFALSEQVGKTGEVIGLDFSENMLSVAKERNKTFDYNNLQFIQGNAMELPFEENTFDYATIGFGLRNVPDYLQVLKEMRRVVKPGGLVVCLETSQPTMPIYKQLYYFYFKHIMPLFGKIFAKSYKEYVWLHESAKDFPGKDALKQFFEEAGLVNVQVKSYTGGVAAMHMGEKRKDSKK
ncbi:demethylmenaquinone methyltransferase / 2-methoxy-6-polyprenyl-1,4-benzoquinol methylase [Gracilibacillus ureilyticus]|uniref:Demethylmenaquinone methyltransferase n=1 Tax=Gracilibacillus ureilyticus TaxID=531814 RepID=A0A1H9LPE8_9BACI|nr:demethylmenaquinone methyltransferase [Gracilibacillus ureilyticus]SER13382.1 demethylmenaquinone methyltransferase / 2-methoxy-6-polyprenyl-1,4-benzoquinol methylase [Gracilibacillus ureilyticus]